ncbi:MAG TPA: hypothetical protein VMX13_10000 [Sedimentisphaerales bacterium]|nr:hypothetical protein [Sedimentisphaerales bacterium]
MSCYDPANQMLSGLRTCIKIVHQLQKEFSALLVPLQSRIDQQSERVPPSKWSTDFVHPFQWAHAWIAKRCLDAAGL